MEAREEHRACKRVERARSGQTYTTGPWKFWGQESPIMAMRKLERNPQGLKSWGGTFTSFASTLFKLCLFLLCFLSLSVSYSVSPQIHFRNGPKTTPTSTAHKRKFICESTFSFSFSFSCSFCGTFQVFPFFHGQFH